MSRAPGEPRVRSLARNPLDKKEHVCYPPARTLGVDARREPAFNDKSKAFEVRPQNIGLPVQVLVRDNNVDQALKALKKKMQREGIFREMKLRGHYEKPSEKRAREKAEAVRRARKLARKKLQREGLLPVKAKPSAGSQRSPA
jgi:small subunit ribosomal protein S21